MIRLKIINASLILRTSMKRGHLIKTRHLWMWLHKLNTPKNSVRQIALANIILPLQRLFCSVIVISKKLLSEALLIIKFRQNSPIKSVIIPLTYITQCFHFKRIQAPTTPSLLLSWFLQEQVSCTQALHPFCPSMRTLTTLRCTLCIKFCLLWVPPPITPLETQSFRFPS